MKSSRAGIKYLREETASFAEKHQARTASEDTTKSLRSTNLNGNTSNVRTEESELASRVAASEQYLWMKGRDRGEGCICDGLVMKLLRKYEIEIH